MGHKGKQFCLVCFLDVFFYPTSNIAFVASTVVVLTAFNTPYQVCLH